MMASVETYLRRGHRKLRAMLPEPWLHWTLRLLSRWAAGFFLSAAGLAHTPQPIAMGLCCSLSGWEAVAASLGSMLGYRFFWGSAAAQGAVWAGMGGILGLLLGSRRKQPLLPPAMSAFLVAATGLAFQVFHLDGTSFGIYLLRVGVGAASALLFSGKGSGSPIREGLQRGVWVLALAQIAPVVWLNAGVAACAFTLCAAPFPQAVLTGLALDLARITPLQMTAAACAGFFLGRLPFAHKALRCAAPAAAALVLMSLQHSWDLYLLPSLVLGGLASLVLPPAVRHRAGGSTGLAQVRLEVAAGVLTQFQQLMLECCDTPIDQEALLQKARDRACDNCSAQHTCREKAALSVHHLHRPFDFTCRRPARMQVQLQLSREQLYLLRSERSRREELHSAVVQQYRFLADYLRRLADELPQSETPPQPRFRLLVSSRCHSREHSGGDLCCAFPGTRCRYYVLLCDGMGTGLGAACSARSARELLEPMLSAGFPPEHALRSVNALLALRGKAGAVTVDLAELRLDTGRATLYKWGAAPSWLLEKQTVQQLGNGTAPPGLSTQGQETVLRFSLRRGQTLVLLSDGVQTQALWDRISLAPELPTGALAEALLRRGRSKSDDSTVAVIRLERLSSLSKNSDPP